MELGGPLGPRSLPTMRPEPHAITYLRLSVTDRCDMRCAYCLPYRNAVAHAPSVLSPEEIALLVEALARNGITKVRLTGGEPLIRPDVVGIVRSIAHAPGIATVGLTTNGVRLEEMASDLASAGLQIVNISLDTLNPDTFRRITGCDALDDVVRGIRAAARCGFEKVKLNTVVMRGVNESELPAIADIARRLPVEVRFIELMPLGHSSAQWRAMYVPASQIRQMLGDLEPLPYERGSSARRYGLARGGGVVGIISPMSESFCGHCNRIRVTCSGKLKPCLRLAVEEDLRPLLDAPDLASRLDVLINRLSRHKLRGPSPSSSAVQAEAMCAVGG